MELLLSASQAHSWPSDEVALGNAFGLVITDALIECQGTLDEVKRKQLKTKSESGKVGARRWSQHVGVLEEGLGVVNCLACHTRTTCMLWEVWGQLSIELF